MIVSLVFYGGQKTMMLNAKENVTQMKWFENKDRYEKSKKYFKWIDKLKVTLKTGIFSQSTLDF